MTIRTCVICGGDFSTCLTEKSCSIECLRVFNRRKKVRETKYSQKYQAELMSAVRLVREIKEKGKDALL